MIIAVASSMLSGVMSIFMLLINLPRSEMAASMNMNTFVVLIGLAIPSAVTGEQTVLATVVDSVTQLPDKASSRKLETYRINYDSPLRKSTYGLCCFAMFWVFPYSTYVTLANSHDKRSEELLIHKLFFETFVITLSGSVFISTLLTTIHTYSIVTEDYCIAYGSNADE